MSATQRPPSESVANRRVERADAQEVPTDSTDYPPSWDRIYPRCPVCRAEQYALAVIAFSSGECGCWKCHHVIREDARYEEASRG
jgi:hypothetical protein